MCLDLNCAPAERKRNDFHAVLLHSGAPLKHTGFPERNILKSCPFFLYLSKRESSPQLNSLSNWIQTSTKPSLPVHSGNLDLRWSCNLLSHSLALMKSKHHPFSNLHKLSVLERSHTNSKVKIWQVSMTWLNLASSLHQRAAFAIDQMQCVCDMKVYKGLKRSPASHLLCTPKFTITASRALQEILPSSKAHPVLQFTQALKIHWQLLLCGWFIHWFVIVD